MATWYCDPVNGNQNYAGSSFALKTSGTDGVANGTTTFTSATANFTGLAGQRINIGGTYFTIASVNTANSIVLSATRATATGLSFWVGGAMQWIGQVAGSTLGQVAGDTWHCAKTADPLQVQDSSGANVTATFTTESPTITLSAAATANIHTCETAWTADNSSTVNTSTTRKEGSNSATITVTTTAQLRGHAATVQSNYSAFTKFSCWIQSSIAQGANTLKICLCSDTAGATPVNSFTIPFALSAGTWYIIDLDNGSALGASIQSVALYTLAGIAAGTITLDNLLACNRLSLGSIVSKDSAATIDATTDCWYPVRSINGTTLILDTGMASSASVTARGYHGATASGVAIYVRQVQYMNTMLLSATLSGVGTAGSPISFIGGYDTTSDTRTGETWWGCNGAVTTFFSINQNLWDFSHFNLKGGTTTLSISGTNSVFRGSLSHSGSIGLTLSGGSSVTLALYSHTGHGTTAINISSSMSIVLECLNSIGNLNAGLTCNGGAITFLVTGNVGIHNNTGSGIVGNAGKFIIPSGVTLSINNNGGNGIAATSAPCAFTGAGTVTANNNTSTGFSGVFTGSIGRIVTSGNSAAFSIANGLQTTLSIGSCNLGEATKFTHNGSIENSFVAIEKYQDTAGDTRIISSLGTIQSEVTTRHTASGFSWKCQPNASATSTYPLQLPLQPVAVDNTSSTFTVYCNRSDTATLNARVKYYAGDLIGANSDAVGNAAGSAATWEQLSMTVGAGSETTGGFTPYAECWGDAANPVYFDDATCS